MDEENVSESHAGNMKAEEEDIEMGEEQDKEESDAESSDSSDDEDDMAEQQLVAECNALLQKVNENPYMYDNHCELIKSLQKLSDLDKLRSARQRMSEIFPLSEDLWLEWLKDEIRIATDETGRQLVTDLFERAVKDYLSIPVWLEYVQFSIGGMGQEDGVKNIREVFDKALTHCGLHVSKGANLWEAYREFESAVLTGLLPEPGGVPSKEEEDKFSVQHDRVNNLFKRQLTVPLLDLQETMTEYKSWLQEEPDSYTRQVHNKALIKLEKIQPYEDNLITADAPRLEEYKEYIKYEQKEGDPARVQCLYERAIQENCLNTDLWLQYTKYLDNSLKVWSVSIPVYERGVRNCPWCVQLWQNYIMCLERGNLSYDKVKDVFEAALLSGFSQPSEYLLIWTTFIDYLKRRIKWSEDHTKDLETFQQSIEKAVEHLDTFGTEGDPNGTLRQFWATIEAKHCKNLPKARELWQEVMTVGRANEAALWMEFYRFERIYGDAKHCRRLLQRALNSVNDWPESVVDAYINFEREEGTLEQYDQAVSKCEAQMARILERREKEQDQVPQDGKKHSDKKGNKWNKPQHGKQRDQQKFKPQKDQKKFPEHKSNQGRNQDSQKDFSNKEKTQEPSSIKVYKRKHTESSNNSDDGFKVPTSAPLRNQKSTPPPGYQEQKSKTPPPGFTPPTTDTSANETSDSSSQSQFKKPVNPPPGYKGKIPSKDDGQPEEPPAKKIKTETTEMYDGSAGDRTAFVSNLKFEIDEDQLREFFKKCGEIEEIRLVKNIKGKSKGYAYIQFVDQLAVSNSITYDRTLMEGRPMYISKYEHRTQKTKADFRFNTGIEKNKLFVKNLPFTCTQTALETLFSQHGEVKEVRMVTYRNGAPKGMAYVEFVDEQCASQAVLKTDGVEMGEHALSVSISNPPSRNKPLGMRDEYVPSLGKGKKETESRGKARTQVSLMPRALTQKGPQKGKAPPPKQESKTSETTDMDTTDTSAKPGLSNSDFRTMLLKK